MPDPTVRDLLLAKVDELTARMATLLDEIRAVTEQVEPERARSCRNAITMASVMVDETRLRAHARSTNPNRSDTDVPCCPWAHGSGGGAPSRAASVHPRQVIAPK